MATLRVEERPPSGSWAKLRVSPPVRVSAELSGPRARSEDHSLKREASSWEEAGPTSGQTLTNFIPASLVLCDSHVERLISFSEFTAKASVGEDRNGRKKKKKKSSGRGTW